MYEIHTPPLSNNLYYLKRLSMRACWVRTTVTSRSFAFDHVTEWRVVVTVWTEDVTFALGPSSKVKDLEPIQRTLQLLKN